MAALMFKLEQMLTRCRNPNPTNRLPRNITRTASPVRRHLGNIARHLARHLGHIARHLSRQPPEPPVDPTIGFSFFTSYVTSRRTADAPPKAPTRTNHPSPHHAQRLDEAQFLLSQAPCERFPIALSTAPPLNPPKKRPRMHPKSAHVHQPSATTPI